MATALNRTIYDTCAYSKALSESVAPINYVLNPLKYEHCGKCRMELGIIGGTAVSHINGNLVDLENDLFNITRPATRCPNYKFAPGPAGAPIQSHAQPQPGRIAARDIDAKLMHLRPCQMVEYPAVPQPPKPVPYTCS
jgi:hypothetical protein